MPFRRTETAFLDAGDDPVPRPVTDRLVSSEVDADSNRPSRRESAGDAIPPLDERWPDWARDRHRLAWIASFGIGVFLGVLLRR